MSGAVLLAIYAFTGFEVLAVPGGEVRDPARTIPFALLVGLAVVAVIYTGVQVVAVGTLPDLGELHPAARRCGQSHLRPPGLARDGGGRPPLHARRGARHSSRGRAHALRHGGATPAPRVIAAMHPRFRTPHVGLLVSAAGMLIFTIVTTFASAVTITVGLRVIIYIVTCAALPIAAATTRDARRPPFAHRPGRRSAVGCIVVCVGLLASRPWPDIIQLAIVLAVGMVAWAGATNVGRR